MTRGHWAAGAAAIGLLAGVAGAGQAAAQTAYDQAVENTAGLVGYYPFTTTSHANSVVNGYTGVLNGNAVIGGSGSGFGIDPNQSSLVLANDPNSSSYATAGGSNPLTGAGGASLTAGTVVAWIKLADLPSVLNRTFSVAGESQDGDDFDLQIENDNVLRLYSGSSGSIVDPNAFTSDVGQWLFVAGSFTDGGASDLYVNGVLVVSGGTGHSGSTGDFYQGQSNVFGNREFDGSLGGVALFNTQLTGDQISGLYSAAFEQAPPPTGGNAVPEPASWALMIAGFGLAGAALRRRRLAPA